MFKNEDFVNYQMFKRIVDNCDFNLKGEAVIKAALLKRWFDELGGKIEGSLPKPDKEDKGKK